MMILIVEDDENKLHQLKQIITDAVPTAEIEIARSLQSGIRVLRQRRSKLIILDMTLPNFDIGPDEPGGGVIHSFGGREFLKQMERFEIVVPVIVVTQFETFGKPPNVVNFDELDAKLRADHASLYKGAVYYHASIHDWKEHLKQLISDATK